MQFSGKFGLFTPPLEGSRPPSGKSWIRHCLPLSLVRNLLFDIIFVSCHCRFGCLYTGFHYGLSFLAEFEFISAHRSAMTEFPYEQECILVGCVPPTRDRTGESIRGGRVSLTETHPGQSPLWTETPMGRDPFVQRFHGQTPPWIDTPPWTKTTMDRAPLWTDLLGQRPLWTETPLDRDLSGQRLPWTETPLDRDHPGQTIPLG